MSDTYVRFDEWPLVVLGLGEGEISELELRGLLEQCTEGASRRSGGFVMLHDLRNTTGLTPAQRRALADSMSQDDAVARRCLGQALVIDAPIARHMFTAVLWMSKAVYPVQVFGSEQEARTFLRERLRSAGITLRPAKVG